MTDPILLEIFKNKLSSIAEEMGLNLQKTAYSPNIKERKDFSCAIFDSSGRLVAQAAHIPVHLGSMPESVKSALKKIDFKEGDMVVLNDPYAGGTHLPDITLVAPVFYKGKLLFFVANRAHHADVGGISAGSMPLSTSIFQEGIIIPPVKLVKEGKIDREILEFIKSNVRTPDEREGDFFAQISANITGIRRLNELISRYTEDTVIEYVNALNDYSEKMMRNKISQIPDGDYSFTDYIEDDGAGNRDIKISVDIKIKGSDAVVDFSNSAPQTEGSLNAVRAITLSAVYYVFRSLLHDDIPVNDGCFRPVKVITKKGTVVDCTHPSPVSGGNVETSQRIVDVVLGALSQAIPEEIPAASQGTMNNVTIGGINPDTGKPFTYYETIGGGMGGFAGGNGESGIQSHMTNTMNTPIEALEFEYPLMVVQYSLRKNSGGNGLFKGGDGIIRAIRFLCDVEVTVISERRRIPPYGLFGGEPGEVGENIVIHKGKKIKEGGKFHRKLKKGDSLIIKTPGGGGYGKVT
ncbi:hydantoinase B/oxoprolinase family protein [Persephonella atlantica]|uniref:Hydantoinase B/oxoprolinase family protein n=1 Tax=Persephonella atlantica TaxID=2699429 RepID=A0ABS1GGB8_9AQUI|nr:hydantoinase B/oxoprolinase family protein [Persephonella atlantica]MBK3331916.1 hydantoinase B/oxoprolinase family protein [Persephonella atlantica]